MWQAEGAGCNNVRHMQLCVHLPTPMGAPPPSCVCTLLMTGTQNQPQPEPEPDSLFGCFFSKRDIDVVQLVVVAV